MGGVRPHRGITVIPTCGAAAAPVMPQVRRTWGRAESREKPQVCAVYQYMFCKYENAWPNAWSCLLSSIFADATFKVLSRPSPLLGHPSAHENLLGT